MLFGVFFVSNPYPPHTCGFYDGFNTYTYYLTDFEDSEAMLLKCLQDMLVPKYHKYTVYCHNFARFDFIFLHKIFHLHFDPCNIISKELNIISISITSRTKIGKVKPKLYFKDSFCILPSSLDRLGKSFGVETPKGHFPYTFVNANNLNYIGDIPEFKFYEAGTERITIEIYNEIKNNMCSSSTWSIRVETISYLTKDLVCLHQIVLRLRIE